VYRRCTAKTVFTRPGLAVDSWREGSHKDPAELSLLITAVFLRFQDVTPAHRLVERYP